MLENLTAFAHRLRQELANGFPFLASMKPGSVQSYLLTVVLMGVALWVRLAIAPVSAGIQYVTFFPAVTLAAIAGGYRTGLLATAIGLVFATYIFTPPYYSISIAVLQASAWSNMVFLIDGIVMSFAIEAMHQYRQRYALELQQSKEAHAALQGSTQYLKTILDNLFAYVALLDTNGVVQEVNKASLDRAGYLPSDVVGKYFQDSPWWTHDEKVRAQLMVAIEEAKQGQTCRRDLVVRMGNDLVPIDFQISPVRDGDGRVVGLLPMGVDISERKQMEMALRQSEATLEQFKFTLDHTQDGVFIFQPDSLRIIYANHGTKRQTGYSADELMQMTPLDFKPNLSEQQFRAMLQPLLDGSLTANSFETVHRHKDGHDIPVEIMLQLVQRVDLEPRFVAFSRDITERKKAEAETRISAAAFESQEGIMITDVNAVILRINKAFTASTGYRADEIVGQTPRVVQSGRHDTAFYAAMWESIDRNGSWAGEIWNRHKDGEIHPKWLTITAVKAADGAVTHYVGTEIDITERKQAQRDLQASEARFRSIFENANTGIASTDGRGQVIGFNEAFRAMLGYDADVLMRMNFADFTHPDDFKLESVFFGEILAGQRESYRITKRYIASDARILWVDISVAVIRDTLSEEINFVGVVQDITEHKKIEDEVRQLAFYDTLTNLPNRRLLMDRLNQTMAASKRSAQYGALMFLDLDNFKSLNDTHGHEVGDLLLIEAADRLKSCVREMDTVARFGGDEFVVMLSELDGELTTSAAQAMVVAEKIRTTLSAPYRLIIRHAEVTDTTVEHHCSVSIGVVLFFNHDAPPDDILKWADTAMYQAKAAGRNSIRIHDPKC